MRRRIFTLLALLGAAPARAQLLPERGPAPEQREFATAVLIGPEATLLGGFLLGGSAYLVADACCTGGGEAVDVTPVAIGAGIGMAIGSTWSIWAVCDRFHPGSRRNAAIGGVLGAASAAAFYFGGPPDESYNDALLRFLAGLFLPTLSAYAGWHLDSGGFDGWAALPSAPASLHVGPTRASPRPAVPSLVIRF